MENKNQQSYFWMCVWLWGIVVALLIGLGNIADSIRELTKVLAK